MRRGRSDPGLPERGGHLALNNLHGVSCEFSAHAISVRSAADGNETVPCSVLRLAHAAGAERSFAPVFVLPRGNAINQLWP